jgi:hypothetical protein
VWSTSILLAGGKLNTCQNQVSKQEIALVMYEDINTQHYFTSARIMADHALILTIKPDITIRVLQFCLKHAI